MTNKLALVVAVVLGVLSILGVRFYVDKIKKSYEDKVAPVQIPVAMRDLKQGDEIKAGDVDLHEFPHGVVDALGDSYYLGADKDKLVGLKVIVPSIKAGQVFQQYHFRAQSTKTRLGGIGNEFRALTVITKQDAGLAGMLRPGDKVDVIVTEGFKDLGGGVMPGHAAGKELKITSTLAQKVEVLAVDNSTDPEANYPDYSTVTLKLRPLEANRLVHAVDNNWPFHLARMDDTAQQIAATNPVFADYEFDKVWPEIKAFFDAKVQARVNGGR